MEKTKKKKRTVHQSTVAEAAARANDAVGSDDDIGADDAALSDLRGGVDEVVAQDVLAGGQLLRVPLPQEGEVEARAGKEILRSIRHIGIDWCEQPQTRSQTQSQIRTQAQTQKNTLGCPTSIQKPGRSMQ